MRCIYRFETRVFKYVKVNKQAFKINTVVKFLYIDRIITSLNFIKGDLLNERNIDAIGVVMGYWAVTYSQVNIEVRVTELVNIEVTVTELGKNTGHSHPNDVTVNI